MCGVTGKDVQDALKTARERLGSDVALAVKLRVASAYIPRLLTQPPDSFRTHTETALRIAAVIGRAPREVLEAIGQGDVADVLEQYYTPIHAAGAQPPPRPLSDEEVRLLDDVAALPPHRQTLVREIIGEFKRAGEKRRGPRYHGPDSPDSPAGPDVAPPPSERENHAPQHGQGSGRPAPVVGRSQKRA